MKIMSEVNNRADCPNKTKHKTFVCPDVRITLKALAKIPSSVNVLATHGFIGNVQV